MPLISSILVRLPCVEQTEKTSIFIIGVFGFLKKFFKKVERIADRWL